MNRFILTIIIIILSVFFLQGTQFPEDHNQGNVSPNDISLSLWKNKLANTYGIPSPAIQLAFSSYFELQEKELLTNDTILTIIDFSRPSIEKRLFILDLKNQKIIINTFVAHGKRTGVDIAENFSNNNHSNKSSLGVYISKETYMGKHGYSLRLDGMSPGLNDNARKRAIVIHGADYVSESYIKKYGRLGRSFGCPAVSNEESEDLINLIKEGSCLFIYHPILIAKS